MCQCSTLIIARELFNEQMIRFMPHGWKTCLVHIIVLFMQLYFFRTHKRLFGDVHLQTSVEIRSCPWVIYSADLIHIFKSGVSVYLGMCRC
jgi:hypothetical protein